MSFRLIAQGGKFMPRIWKTNMYGRVWCDGWRRDPSSATKLHFVKDYNRMQASFDYRKAIAAPFSCVAALLMWAVRSLLQGDCRVQILGKPCIKGGGLSCSECAVLLKANPIYTVALDLSELACISTVAERCWRTLALKL